jgi:hypothetical protein
MIRQFQPIIGLSISDVGARARLLCLCRDLGCTTRDLAIHRVGRDCCDAAVYDLAPWDDTSIAALRALRVVCPALPLLLYVPPNVPGHILQVCAAFLPSGLNCSNPSAKSEPSFEAILTPCHGWSPLS